jgi:hypothetical protein
MNSWLFLRNVILKGLLLFLCLNLAFAIWFPMQDLGKLSLYNHVIPGRLRFPFGESPERAYNFSLYSVDAMFASHIIAKIPKSEDEYRIIILGDSSVWGTLLKPEETLAGYLDSMQKADCQGRIRRFYNLGYPTLSLTKDLMLLEQAMQYQPDLIIWLVTLESFPHQKQLDTPLMANNPTKVRPLIAKYQLPLNPMDPAFEDLSFWQRTVIGQRRTLADIIRLQLYGLPWAATSIDQDYLSSYQPAQLDFDTDVTYYDWQPPDLPENELSFEILQAGMQIAGDVPVLLINEPILISSGENSDLRYNFFYPRWAYDRYRQLLAATSAEQGWDYLDFWNLVPASEYTNSAIHLTPSGSRLLAQHVMIELENTFCQ